MVKDPVWDMHVDINNAAAKSVYQGQTVYFCSNLCKLMLDQEPKKFMQGSDTDPATTSHS